MGDGIILLVRKESNSKARRLSMSQKEMARYLKMITVGIGILFLLFVLWFLPSSLRQILPEMMGRAFYIGSCIFILVTAVPCLICLCMFWGVCVRIEQDSSLFQRECTGAEADEPMDDGGYDPVCRAAGSMLFAGWYQPMGSMIFAVFLILFLCIALSVICAVLSHLVYKASRIQEEQDLTI